MSDAGRTLAGMTGVSMVVKRALVVLAGCTVLTACGGGSNGGGEGGGGSSTGAEPTAASSSPSETARPAEVEECQTAVSRMDDLASEMDTLVVDEPAQFTQLFDRMQALRGDADSFCSTTVKEPMSMGVYFLARANAGYTACDFVEMCNRDKVERDLVKGTGLLHDAAEAAARTE
ncbi:hypothetical protein ACNKF0_09310 [Nocardioides sp. T5]|uniref:hypothetical protein n=1 Tax=Nocardioides sp. T5 TaxID=3400182 RepID=UPI003A8AAD64